MRKVKRLLPLLLLSITATAFCQHSSSPVYFTSGTSIIGVFTKDTLWLAADSKVTDKGPRGNYNISKIRSRNNIFFGFTNHAIVYRDNKDLFNAFEIVDKVLKETKSYQVGMFKADEALKLSIAQVLNTSKIPRAQMDSITKEPFLNFVIASFQDDTSTYQIFKYHLVKTELGIEVVSARNPEWERVFFLGKYQHIESYIYSHPSIFRGWKNIKEKLVCLIAHQAANDSALVGMPADVLKATRKKQMWYRKNYHCLDSTFLGSIK